MILQAMITRLRTTLDLLSRGIRGALVVGLLPSLTKWLDFPISGRGVAQFLVWLDEQSSVLNWNNAKSYSRWVRDQSTQELPDSDRVVRVHQAQFEPADLTREYVLLDSEEVIVPAWTLAAMLNVADQTGADVVYCDEDVEAGTEFTQPLFKPQFSPHLYRVDDYIGPILLVKRETLKQVDTAAPNISDALISMVLDKGGKVVRSDGIVHWREARRRRRSPLSDVGHASTTVIIPTKDKLDLLSKCVEGLLIAQESPSEILIVDNGSTEAATLGWLSKAEADIECLRVLPDDQEYNWSRLNNFAAHHAVGDVLIFMNNDIEVDDPNWLEPITSLALEPDVGTVGVRLHFPDSTIQHAGIVVGMGGWADHVYRGAAVSSSDENTCFINPYLVRNVVASTGACLAIEADKFRRLGGFDERLAHMGDLELGIRCHRERLWNVYCGQVGLTHHEAMTRKSLEVSQDELDLMRPMLSEFLPEGDPFYNPHLDLRIRIPRPRKRR